MNKNLEKALAKPGVLLMGPMISPASGDRIPIHITPRRFFSYPDFLLLIAQEIGKIVKKSF